MAMRQTLAAGGIHNESGSWIYSGSAEGGASSLFDCLVAVGEPTPFTLTVTTSPGAERPDIWGHAACVTFISDDNTTEVRFGNFNEHGTGHTIVYGQNSGNLSGTLVPNHNYYLHVFVADDSMQLNPTLDNLHPTYNSSRSAKFTLQVGPPTQLPPIGPLTYVTAAPPRSNNPWQFSVVNTNVTFAADTTITLQTTATPGNAASWESLADMVDGSSNVWTAQLTSVPAGDRYFRAILSVPGCVSSATAVVGPVNIQQALPPDRAQHSGPLIC